MKPALMICMVVTVLLNVVSIAGCQKSVSQADLDAMLPGLVQGCRDNVAGINSGKGPVTIHTTEYTYEDGSPKAYETSGKYSVVFDGAKYKIVGESTCIKNESSAAVRKPGDIAPYSIANDGEIVTELLQYSGSRGLAMGNMRTKHMGFLMSSILMRNTDPVGGQGIYPIDYYPAKFNEKNIDKGLRAVRSEQLDGHECIVVRREVELIAPDGDRIFCSREFWVDPNRGFCVPLVRVWIETSKSAGPLLVVEATATLRDYGNGIWAPRESTSSHSELDDKGGKRIYYHSETTYGADYQVNAPIDPAELLLKIPAMTLVTDVDKAAP